MFDSSVLKGMKLPELQEIAKLAKTIKFAGVKKEALIEMIIAQQASAMNQEVENSSDKEEKGKRVRIKPEAKIKKGSSQDLFSEEKTTVVEVNEAPTVYEKSPKNPKFKKKDKFKPELEEVSQPIEVKNEEIQPQESQESQEPQEQTK
jgi:transcription termination factor Rho